MNALNPYRPKDWAHTIAGSQADQLTTDLIKAGFDVSRWKDRIYLNGAAHNVSIYIEMAKPDQPAAGLAPFADCRLCCWTTERRLSTVIRVGHAKLTKFNTWRRLHLAGIMPDTPPADWNQVEL